MWPSHEYCHGCEGCPNCHLSPARYLLVATDGSKKARFSRLPSGAGHVVRVRVIGKFRGCLHIDFWRIGSPHQPRGLVVGIGPVELPIPGGGGSGGNINPGESTIAGICALASGILNDQAESVSAENYHWR